MDGLRKLAKTKKVCIFADEKQATDSIVFLTLKPSHNPNYKTYHETISIRHHHISTFHCILTSTKLLYMPRPEKPGRFYIRFPSWFA